MKNDEDTKRRLKNGEDKQSRRQLVETESTGVADLGMGLKASKNKKDSGFHTNWDQNLVSIGIHELQDDEVDRSVQH
nr:hypothetical protein CFP56_50971 [Quercus suber]